MGKDAYKPEVYGQAIVIDQKITREGIRTYKLKSQSGNVNYLRSPCTIFKSHLLLVV